MQHRLTTQRERERERERFGSPRAQAGAKSLGRTCPSVGVGGLVGRRWSGRKMVYSCDGGTNRPARLSLKTPAQPFDTLPIFLTRHKTQTTPIHSLLPPHRPLYTIPSYQTNNTHTTPSIWSKQVRGSQQTPSHSPRDSSLTKRRTVVAGAAGGIGQVSTTQPLPAHSRHTH